MIREQRDETAMELTDALTILARDGSDLRDRHHLEWNLQAREATGALRLLHVLDGGRPSSGDGTDTRRLTLTALVGGASSGKSTIFNNLLGGRLVSRVTARGHSTRGPILAVHDSRRDTVEPLLAGGMLFSSLRHEPGELDDNLSGEPDAVHVVYHHVDDLRDVLLADMPDLTSEPARLEGDVAIATLPWFDRLIVVIDHERWFDRQTIGRLREASEQFAQERLVLFNRSREGRLKEADARRLVGQAERLAARQHWILEFRRGRGLCSFPPGTFDPLLRAVNSDAPRRTRRLVQYLGRAARGVLNNNAERAGRLAQLRESLDRAAERILPSESACLTALMTPDEKSHLDIVARTLRLDESRQWLQHQANRIRTTLRRHVPVVGPLLAGEPRRTAVDEEPATDRASMGRAYFVSNCDRQRATLREAADNSDFWDEVRRWTDLTPSDPDTGLENELRERVCTAVADLDAALAAWTAKVESECRGVTPRLVGAVGGTTLAGAIVLVALSGPVAAITWPAAKIALAAALGKLATSAGVGAVAGRPLNRLLAVVRERLIGSPEFEAVRAGARAYRETIAAAGRTIADHHHSRAADLVLGENEPLVRALRTLSDAGEVS